MRWLLLAAFCLGCSKPPPALPTDETLTRLGHAGDIAYTLEEPSQAAEQYRAELVRARERDDAGAIADAGFNLATAQLRAGQPRAAIETCNELRAELARRDITDAAFDLVMASAWFRLKDFATADRLAAGLTLGRTPRLADAAWFLRGLIADQAGDRAGLQHAAASLTPAADAADRMELQARLTHDAETALHAADLRRNDLDYRGMARALALAAQYTPEPMRAADLYLRAGRSAAAQHDIPQARDWLARARKRAPEASLRADADHALRELPSE